MMSSANSKKTGSIHPQLVSRYKRFKWTVIVGGLLSALLMVMLFLGSWYQLHLWTRLLALGSFLLVAFLAIQYKYQRLSWVLDNVAPIESTIVLKRTGSQFTAEFGSGVMLDKKGSKKMELAMPDKTLRLLFTGETLPAKVYFDPDSGCPLAIETSQGLIPSIYLSSPLMLSLYLPENGGRRLNWPAILYALIFALVFAAWELKIM